MGEAMKMSMQRWKEERERNAEYIEVMRKAKEERKKEIEAQETALLQMKEEAEAEAAKAEEEGKKLENTTAEASSKPTEAKQEDSKQNFGDQKKFKSKDEREYFEALTTLIKPFDVTSMETEDLKKKVAELYDIFTNLINDKINLNNRLV